MKKHFWYFHSSVGKFRVLSHSGQMFWIKQFGKKETILRNGLTIGLIKEGYKTDLKKAMVHLPAYNF